MCNHKMSGRNALRRDWVYSIKLAEDLKVGKVTPSKAWRANAMLCLLVASVIVGALLAVVTR